MSSMSIQDRIRMMNQTIDRVEQGGMSKPKDEYRRGKDQNDESDKSEEEEEEEEEEETMVQPPPRRVSVVDMWRKRESQAKEEPKKPSPAPKKKKSGNLAHVFAQRTAQQQEKEEPQTNKERRSTTRVPTSDPAPPRMTVAEMIAKRSPAHQLKPTKPKECTQSEQSQNGEFNCATVQQKDEKPLVIVSEEDKPKQSMSKPSRSSSIADIWSKRSLAGGSISKKEAKNQTDEDGDVEDDDDDDHDDEEELENKAQEPRRSVADIWTHKTETKQIKPSWAKQASQRSLSSRTSWSQSEDHSRTSSDQPSEESGTKEEQQKIDSSRKVQSRASWIKSQTTTPSEDRPSPKRPWSKRTFAPGQQATVVDQNKDEGDQEQTSESKQSTSSSSKPAWSVRSLKPTRTQSTIEKNEPETSSLPPWARKSLRSRKPQEEKKDDDNESLGSKPSWARNELRPVPSQGRGDPVEQNMATKSQDDASTSMAEEEVMEQDVTPVSVVQKGRVTSPGWMQKQRWQTDNGETKQVKQVDSRPVRRWSTKSSPASWIKQPSEGQLEMRAESKQEDQITKSTDEEEPHRTTLPTDEVQDTADQDRSVASPSWARSRHSSTAGDNRTPIAASRPSWAKPKPWNESPVSTLTSPEEKETATETETATATTRPSWARTKNTIERTNDNSESTPKVPSWVKNQDDKQQNEGQLSDVGASEGKAETPPFRRWGALKAAPTSAPRNQPVSRLPSWANRSPERSNEPITQSEVESAATSESKTENSPSGPQSSSARRSWPRPGSIRMSLEKEKPPIHEGSKPVWMNRSLKKTGSSLLPSGSTNAAQIEEDSATIQSEPLSPSPVKIPTKSSDSVSVSTEGSSFKWKVSPSLSFVSTPSPRRQSRNFPPVASETPTPTGNSRNSQQVPDATRTRPATDVWKGKESPKLGSSPLPTSTTTPRASGSVTALWKQGPSTVGELQRQQQPSPSRRAGSITNRWSPGNGIHQPAENIQEPETKEPESPKSSVVDWPTANENEPEPELENLPVVQKQDFVRSPNRSPKVKAAWRPRDAVPSVASLPNVNHPDSQSIDGVGIVKQPSKVSNTESRLENDELAKINSVVAERTVLPKPPVQRAKTKSPLIELAMRHKVVTRQPTENAQVRSSESAGGHRITQTSPHRLGAVSLLSLKRMADREKQRISPTPPHGQRSSQSETVVKTTVVVQQEPAHETGVAVQPKVRKPIPSKLSPSRAERAAKIKSRSTKNKFTALGRSHDRAPRNPPPAVDEPGRIIPKSKKKTLEQLAAELSVPKDPNQDDTSSVASPSSRKLSSPRKKKAVQEHRKKLKSGRRKDGMSDDISCASDGLSQTSSYMSPQPMEEPKSVARTPVYEIPQPIYAKAGNDDLERPPENLDPDIRSVNSGMTGSVFEPTSPTENSNKRDIAQLAKMHVQTVASPLSPSSTGPSPSGPSPTGAFSEYKSRRSSSSTYVSPVQSEMEELHLSHGSAPSQEREHRAGYGTVYEEGERPYPTPYTPAHNDTEQPYPTPYTPSPRVANASYSSPFTPSPRSLNNKISRKGSNRYRHRKQLEERKASNPTTPASEAGQSELSFFSSSSSVLTGSAASQGSKGSHSTLANRASKALQARRHRQSHVDQAAAQNLTRRMLSPGKAEARTKKRSSSKKGQRGLASRYNTSDRFIQAPNGSFGSDSTNASSHLYSLASDESGLRKPSTRSAEKKIDHFVEKSSSSLGALASAYKSANFQQIANDMKQEVTSSVSDSITALATEISKLVPKSPQKSKENSKSKHGSLENRAAAASPDDEDIAIEVEYIGGDEEEEQSSGENAASPSRLKSPDMDRSTIRRTAGESSYESQKSYA